MGASGRVNGSSSVPLSAQRTLVGGVGLILLHGSISKVRAAVIPLGAHVTRFLVTTLLIRSSTVLTMGPYIWLMVRLE